VLLTWFRDLSIAGQDDTDSLLINADRSDQLKQIAASLDRNAPARAAKAIRVAKEALGGNANLRMTVEVMLTDIWQALAA
jgi:hypothetical protein